jgi:hypothetical protein
LQQGNDGDVTIIVNLMRLLPENRDPYEKAFLEAADANGEIFIKK